MDNSRIAQNCFGGNRATAVILKFPRVGPFVVRVDRQDDAWLVVCRDHGWLHGNRDHTMQDAEEIARGYGVAVRGSP